MESISKEKYLESIKNYILSLKYNINFEIVGNLVKIFSRGKILIIGDIHGDNSALDEILNKIQINNFLENEKNLLISLGDLVDRGTNGIEVIYKLTNLGLKYPGQIIILRGNHEISRFGEVFPFDFDKETYLKYGNHGKHILNYTINNFFNNLPLAAYIENEIFFVHGGIPIRVPSLEEISNADPNDSIGYQLRWNDPVENVETYIESNRGPGIYLFGPKITEKFLEKNKLKKIIRSHQLPGKNGYKLNHRDSIITIFSAKNTYNLLKASYAIYDSEENKLTIKIF